MLRMHMRLYVEALQSRVPGELRRSPPPPLPPLRKYPVLREAHGLDIATAQSLEKIPVQPEWSISADTFLEQLTQPTLAIFGERDALVDWRESVQIYRSSFARSGNRDLTIKRFKEADHEMI